MEEQHDSDRHYFNLKNLFLYLGFGLLLTHEMDAMSNHEWRVFPLINTLTETTGEFIFLIAHVPIFAIVIAFLASMNKKTRVRTQKLVCSFFIIHGALHFAFSGHANYEFMSVISNFLIVGAALCGIAYFISVRFGDSQ